MIIVLKMKPLKITSRPKGKNLGRLLTTGLTLVGILGATGVFADEVKKQDTKPKQTELERELFFISDHLGESEIFAIKEKDLKEGTTDDSYEDDGIEKVIGGLCTEFAVSSDRRYFACTENKGAPIGIYMVDTEKGTANRVTNPLDDNAVGDYDLIFGNDERLYFSRAYENGRVRHICSTGLDGSDFRNLTKDHKVPKGVYRVSNKGIAILPDGRIIFSCQYIKVKDEKRWKLTDYRTICIIDNDGSDKRDLTDRSTDDTQPSVSQGRIITYVSSSGIENAIKTMEIDGSNKKTWVKFNSPREGVVRSPVLSNDGRHVYFSLRGDIYRVGINGSLERITNTKANEYSLKFN